MIPGFANLNYYEVLDINTGTDAKEIQEAYYLVREAFSKGALASYSLYPPEEREEIGKLIEEAYHILFDDQSRREYDRSLSENRLRVERGKRTQQAALPFAETELQKALAAEAAAAEEIAQAAAESEATEEVVEAEVVNDENQADLPFMDPTPAPALTEPAPSAETAEPTAPAAGSATATGDEGEPAGAPETGADPDATEELSLDREGETGTVAPVEVQPEADAVPAEATPSTNGEPAAESAAAGDPTPTPAPVRPATPSPMAAADPTPSPSETTNPAISVVTTGPVAVREPELATGPRRALLEQLRDGITGPNLKRVREQRGLTLEQAFEVTRIRRPILQSIEEEEFDKLPAAVFLRGMVANYARFLGIPDPESVARSYMERITAAIGG